MKLRPYQETAVANVISDWDSGLSDVLGVMATGLGKTQVFLALLLRLLGENKRAIVIAHTRDLIKQPLDRLRLMAPPGWEEAGWRGDGRTGRIGDGHDDYAAQITFCTFQALGFEHKEGERRHLARYLMNGAPDYLIVDECHHANAPMLLNLIRTLREVNPELKHLGVTATPVRGDGDGLAKVYERSKKTPSGASFLYDISFGVKQHFLSMPRGLEIATGISVKGVETRAGDYSPSQLAKRFDTDAGRAIIVSSYHLYGYGRRSIAFTASVKGAHDLAACFNDLSLIPPDLLLEAAVAGYKHLHGAEAEVDGAALIAEWAARPMRAIGVDGKTPDRERILDDFRHGLATGFEAAPYHVFANCQVATEGFDAPGASCVLMCRPTRAQGAYIQMVGRGLRPAGRDPDPDRKGMAVAGEDCLVLDFVPKDGGSKLVLLGDVLGMPKMMRAAAKQLKEAETGEVQLGFTFDGSRFNTDGSPLEIIARRIEFLEDSAHVWEERGDWLTLGLGAGPDGLERILAITPPRDGESALWGLWRRPIEGSEDPITGRPRYGPWCKGRLAQGELAELCALGEEKAARWGASTLTNKGRGWHKQDATEGQLKYLRKLMPPEERRQVGGRLTKQMAAALITHFQAREVLSFEITN